MQAGTRRTAFNEDSLAKIEELINYLNQIYFSPLNQFNEIIASLSPEEKSFLYNLIYQSIWLNNLDPENIPENIHAAEILNDSLFEIIMKLTNVRRDLLFDKICELAEHHETDELSALLGRKKIRLDIMNSKRQTPVNVLAREEQNNHAVHFLVNKFKVSKTEALLGAIRGNNEKLVGELLADVSAAEKKEWELVKAARCEDLSLVSELLKEEVKWPENAFRMLLQIGKINFLKSLINQKLAQASDLVLAAAFLGDADLTFDLIVNFNAGMRPAMAGATRGRQLELMKKLIQHDDKITDDDIFVALATAFSKNNFSLVKFIIDNFCSNLSVPLYFAAACPHGSQLIERIIFRHVEKFNPENDLCGAMKATVETGNIPLFRHLLKMSAWHGASKPIETALIEAATQRKWEFVSILMEKWLNINFAISVAIQNKQLDLVNYIVQSAGVYRVMDSVARCGYLTQDNGLSFVSNFNDPEMRQLLAGKIPFDHADERELFLRQAEYCNHLMREFDLNFDQAIILTHIANILVENSEVNLEEVFASLQLMEPTMPEHDWQQIKTIVDDELASSQERRENLTHIFSFWRKTSNEQAIGAINHPSSACSSNFRK